MGSRILALDIGERRIGIAVSDPLGITAQPVGTYHRKNIDEDYEYLGATISKFQPSIILAGLPSRTDGKESDMANKVKEFCGGLSGRFGVEVKYHDERFTTAMAQRTLIEANMRREKRKNVVDTVAAVIILQSYLESISNRLT